MNNYEKDERAKELCEILTPYALARRIIELEEALEKLRKELEDEQTAS